MPQQGRKGLDPQHRYSRESGNPAQRTGLKRALLDACFRRHDTGAAQAPNGHKSLPLRRQVLRNISY